VEVFLITTLLLQVIQLLTCFIRNDSWTSRICSAVSHLLAAPNGLRNWLSWSLTFILIFVQTIHRSTKRSDDYSELLATPPTPHTHGHTHTHTHPHTQTATHTRTHRQPHTHTHTHTQTHTQTPTPKPRHIHTHPPTSTDTHTDTHAQTHTHTHTVVIKMPL
jgi:hypothetical protein